MSDYFQELSFTPLADGETPDYFLHLARLFRDFIPEELVDTEQLPPPASKDIVKNLETKNIPFGQDFQCPVCLKRETNIDVKELPCKHKFHPGCILPWLSKTNSCPLCRFELATDDENYEAYRKQKTRAKAREEDLKVLHNSMFS